MNILTEPPIVVSFCDPDVFNDRISVWKGGGGAERATLDRLLSFQYWELARVHWSTLATVGRSQKSSCLGSIRLKILQLFHQSNKTA